MKGIRKLLDWTLSILSGGSFLAMVILTCWQVFTRYILKNPSSWSEELVSYLFAWMSLFGASVVVGERGHMNIPILVERMGTTGRKFFAIFAEIIAFLFAAIILLTVQCMYLALTLSQIKPISSFGKFGTIVLFFVLAGGLLSLSGTVSNMFPLNVVISDTAIRFTSSAELTETAMSYRLTGAFFNIIASIALHFPMKFLVSKKINLK